MLRYFTKMASIHKIALCIFLLTAGQVLWKLGVERASQDNLLLTGKSLLALFSSPCIIVGLLLYAIATLVWLGVLSETPLSLAYPLMSASYVLGVVAGVLIFGEHIPVSRWAGVAVVCLGIYLIYK
jgi:drug/metabolite transporter (DMT)-like permease